ncbi:MAG: peptidyl-alpha-hydroxyglycine alpha-amidating lyase family protein [Planctomycetaceae bacterium]
MGWRQIAILLAMVQVATAQAQEAKLPDFPRKNVARTYHVDPSWPKRPDGLNWDHVPGMFVDKSQQVWIFTRTSPPIQIFTTDGRFVRSCGTGVIGKPHQLKLDHQGNVWVADQGNHCVMKLTPEGKPLLVLGTRGEFGDDEHHMNNPTDMVVSPQGDIFVSDGYGNNRVLHFNAKGRFVKMWGKLGVGPGEFSLPHAIAMDSKGRIYVADRNNARVQVFSQAGKFLDQWRNILVPWGFCVTARDEIWVCGSGPMGWRKEDVVLGVPPTSQVLVKFSTAGRVLEYVVVPKGEDGKEQPGQLNWVHSIAVDSKGNLYCGDINGKRAQKFVVVQATKQATRVK